MPTPAITKGSNHFFTTTYEGNGGGQRVGNFVPFTDSGTIDNSVIFNHSDTTMQLQLPAPASAGNQKTFTISCWFKRANLGDQSYLYSIWNGTDDGAPYVDDRHYAQMRTTNQIYVNFWDKGFITNRSFEDTSKWYHYLLAVDTTQATDSDRIKLYIDGDLITTFSGATAYMAQNDDLAFAKRAFTIGNTKSGDNAQEPFDGYIAEFNAIEGQALGPSTFGLTDTSTGRWIPKALSGITYGTNGFRLKFQDSSALGDDTSGNGNDFTATNLASTDQTTDSPTQNFMTFFLQDTGAGTLSEGNLLCDPHTGSGYRTRGTPKTIPQSGKWYMEVKLNVSSGTNYRNHSYGVLDLNQKQIQGLGTSVQFDGQVGGMGIGFNGDRIGFAGLYSTAYDWRLTASSPHSMVNGDFVLMAFDMDNGKAWWGTRDTSGSTTYWYNSSGGTDGDPSTGANPTFTFIPRDHRFMVCQGFYPDSGATLQWYFGSQGFNLTAPTDYGKLSQENFPETDKGIPDLVWIKNRDAADGHQVYDSSRGALLAQRTDTNVVDTTTDDGLQKFLKGGCQIEDDVSINTSGESYVAWNWVANGGTTSANTDGSGATLASTIQANQTAGFSIVTYTGNATAGAKVAHGLSQAPDWLWITSRSLATGPKVYHHKNTAAPETDYLALNATNATFDTIWLNDTAPDSNCFTVGPTGYSTNNLNATYVAYCWHEVPGFSRFGTYVGNGNTNGPFIFTGFKPAWVMVKRTNTTGSWIMWDTKRDEINPMYHRLYANLTNTQGTSGADITFLSNGFKHRRTDSDQNASGSTYVYMAFAEHPFIGNGTNPVTAM